MENKDNKLFVNKTVYTKENYIEFLEFHNKKYNFSYMAYSIIWTIIFLFCIIVAFGSELRLQGVLITIILICFVSYRIIRPKLIVQREMSSDKLDKNNVNTFTFYDKYFEVKNNNGKFNYKYMMICKVFETENFFYLYVSKENAFLIFKNTFSLGSSEDFGDFMKHKRGWKYKSLHS